MSCLSCPALTSRKIYIDRFSGKTVDFTSQSIFFLTHLHADHTKGLGNNFARHNCFVCCSDITRTLAVFAFPKLAATFFVLEPYEEYFLNDGVTVRAYPSNHCDGSFMYCFQVPHAGTILVTSDFRMHNNVYRWPERLTVDELYYDDTFESVPGYQPTMDETCVTTAEVIDLVRQDLGQKTRICINCNILGSEPVLRKLAQAYSERFVLSSEIMDSARGPQLQLLLPDALDCDGPFPPITLGLYNSQVDSGNCVWIFLSAMRILCDDNEVIEKFKIHDNKRKIFVYFATHASKGEIEELGDWTRAKKMIPCGSRIDFDQLRCRASSAPRE